MLTRRSRLRPGKRLQRRSKLSRGSKPLRRSRINPANWKRKADRLENDFGLKSVWIRSLRICATCDGRCGGRFEASHTRTRGSRLGDRRHLIPQRKGCHDRLHRGPKTFQREMGVDLDALAVFYEAKWQREKADWIAANPKLVDEWNRKLAEMRASDKSRASTRPDSGARKGRVGDACGARGPEDQEEKEVGCG